MSEYQKGVDDERNVSKLMTLFLEEVVRGHINVTCQTGSDLYGPFVQKCEDTFTSRVGSKIVNNQQLEDVKMVK